MADPNHDHSVLSYGRPEPIVLWPLVPNCTAWWQHVLHCRQDMQRSFVTGSSVQLWSSR